MSDRTSEMIIVRDMMNRVWVIEGTNLVVDSPQNKVIIGKLQVAELSPSDRKDCMEKGWSVLTKDSRSTRNNRHVDNSLDLALSKIRQQSLLEEETTKRHLAEAYAKLAVEDAKLAEYQQGTRDYIDLAMKNPHFRKRLSQLNASIEKLKQNRPHALFALANNN